MKNRSHLKAGPSKTTFITLTTISIFSATLGSAIASSGATEQNTSRSDLLSYGITWGESAEKATSWEFSIRHDNSSLLNRFGLNLEKYGIDTTSEYSLFRWDLDGEELWGASTTLNFSYSFDNYAIGKLVPFVEFGTGIGLLAETSLGDLDMASAFQFRNQIGAGLATERLAVMLQASHLSNAGLVDPNDGIDLISVQVRFSF